MAESISIAHAHPITAAAMVVGVLAIAVVLNAWGTQIAVKIAGHREYGFREAVDATLLIIVLLLGMVVLAYFFLPRPPGAGPLEFIAWNQTSIALLVVGGRGLMLAWLTPLDLMGGILTALVLFVAENGIGFFVPIVLLAMIQQ